MSAGATGTVGPVRLAALAALTVVAGHPALVRAQNAPDPGAAAPAPSAVTLDEVIASVERSYPLIQAARQDQLAAAGEQRAAAGGFDPTVRLRGSVNVGGYYEYGRLDASVEQPTPVWGASLFAGWRLGRGFDPGVQPYAGIPPYYGYLATFDRGEVRAGINVPLVRNGPTDRRRTAVARASLGPEIAALGVYQQRLETVRAASSRYWEWVAAGRRLAIARQLLQLATARDDALAARVERGDIPAVERTENARAVLQRRGFVVASERALQQTAIELSLYLRGEDGTPRVVADPDALPAGFPEPTPVDDAGDDRAQVETALRRRPDVRRLDLTREQLRLDYDLAHNQQLPAVDLTVAYTQDLGDPTAGLDPRFGRPALEAALSVEWATFNRAASGRAEALAAGLGRNAEQLELARDRVAADVLDARSALAAAYQRAQLARQERAVAEELAGAETRRFDLGESTLLLVNLREQSTAEAALREVDALLDYHRARASYDAAVAALPPEPAAR